MEIDKCNFCGKPNILISCESCYLKVCEETCLSEWGGCLKCTPYEQGEEYGPESEECEENVIVEEDVIVQVEPAVVRDEQSIKGKDEVLLEETPPDGPVFYDNASANFLPRDRNTQQCWVYEHIRLVLCSTSPPLPFPSLNSNKGLYAYSRHNHFVLNIFIL